MHPDAMNYFKGSELAQMSDGTYRIIRDLGLVKGGKGLRHHETLLTLSVTGVASKLVRAVRHCARLLQARSAGPIPLTVRGRSAD
jgi:hypothetical protein